MCCCDSDSVQVSKMALEVKSGPMLWYKRRIFGSNWRDVHSVLYNDSSLLWYQDKSRQEQDGGVVLKEAPELIAYGVYTAQVPDRPSLPEHYEQKEMLAFGVRGKDLVYWFLCPNEEEVASWMAAIVTTLPPPPMPPYQAPPPPSAENQQPATAPGETPPMGGSHQTPAPQYTPQRPPPQYTPMQQQQPSYNPRPHPSVPGQYPPPPNTNNYRPPPYFGNNAVHPQPSSYHPQPSYHPPPAMGGVMGGAPSTVVLQDRGGNGGVGTMGAAGGGFAMGMLLGGAIGTAWGGGGSHRGWGGGWGGGGGHAPSQNDTNININNYYDNDTTTVNNNLDMTNNGSVDQPDQQTPGMVPEVQDGAVDNQPTHEVNEYEPMPEAVEYQPEYQPEPVEYQPEYQPEPVMYQPEYEPEYLPVEDVADYDGGDYGGDDYAGDYGDDYGGGDFGEF